MARQLTLYTGPHCTLCDKARQQIWLAISKSGHQLVEVDITSDVTLLRQYRVTIPVLARADGSELCWPFDKQQLQCWLDK